MGIHCIKDAGAAAQVACGSVLLSAASPSSAGRHFSGQHTETTDWVHWLRRSVCVVMQSKNPLTRHACMICKKSIQSENKGTMLTFLTLLPKHMILMCISRYCIQYLLISRLRLSSLICREKTRLSGILNKTYTVRREIWLYSRDFTCQDIGVFFVFVLRLCLEMSENSSYRSGESDSEFIKPCRKTHLRITMTHLFQKYNQAVCPALSPAQ